MSARTFDAVFWDFGGVITTSPFEAFNRYESERGIPLDFIRGVNTHNPDDNAWAKIERREVSADEFDALFATESEALGHRIPGRDVLGCLYGSVRPEMLAALHAIRDSGRIQACLTNNVSTSTHDRPDVDEAMAIFAHVIESSKVGLRKPEPAFYELACTTAGVSPDRVVFLDDLGINLKPAAAMGMATIKVVDATRALTELGELLQMSLI
jgi:putative hydrolase of the HAD superfamily